MDPISIPALCLTCTKVLVGLYQYLEAIKEAPRHVSDLTTELSAFNFVLTRLKGLIASREDSHRELLRRWADDSKVVLNGCKETLEKIEALVVRAKIKTKSTIKGQVMKCVKWEWKKEEVVPLRLRLENYKSSISLMLQSLSRRASNPLLLRHMLTGNILQRAARQCC